MRVKPTGLKLHSVGNEAFTYETPPEHIRLHTAMLAVAKARSGKSWLLTGILSQLKKAGCMDRILVISDTFDSNRKLMESLNIRASDVFSPSDPDVVQKIIDVIESERDDLLRYRTELERYKKLDKHFMNASVWDDYL